MESKTINLTQLFLRIAIAITFLSAVADRFGLWGAPGQASVTWGNWENFRIYSNSVNSFVPESIGNMLAIVATVFEIIFSIFLLIGFKIRIVSAAAGVLLACFGLAMTISFGIRPALDYSVWVDVTACFLLASIPSYAYSIDSKTLSKT
ncbi:MAG TPA: DoxX family membrane protein [Prolixibacteraceae bacterium]|nr:DoxX family membrane protein [Prolixibacteraceae bacterium]